MDQKIEKIKQDIAGLIEDAKYCDRTQRFDINQEITLKRNQLLSLKRDQLIKRSTGNLITAKIHVESAITTLNEIKIIPTGSELHRCIDQLEQQVDRLNAEIEKS